MELSLIPQAGKTQHAHTSNIYAFWIYQNHKTDIKWYSND